MGARTTTQGYTASGYIPSDKARNKFTAQEHDEETNLEYMHARYHSTGQGRFTSADTMLGSIGNPQSLNRYSYVLNDPMNYSDPSGHLPSYHGSRAFNPDDGESHEFGIAGIWNPFITAMVAAAAETAPKADPEGGGTPENATGEKPDPGSASASSGDTEASTAAKTESNPQKPSAQELVNSGTTEAAERLKIEPCADFFGGGDKGLKALKSLKFSVDPSMPENGHPQAQIQGNNVSVNPNGGLVTPDGVGHTYILVERAKNVTNILTVTLFGADARAFGQLHETGHKTKRFGNTDNDLGPQRLMNGYENNFKIWKACFGGTATKPWTGQPPLIP